MGFYHKTEEQRREEFLMQEAALRQSEAYTAEAEDFELVEPEPVVEAIMYEQLQQAIREERDKALMLAALEVADLAKTGEKLLGPL